MVRSLALILFQFDIYIIADLMQILYFLEIHRSAKLQSPPHSVVVCLSQTGSVYFLWIRHVRLTPDNHWIKNDKVPLKLSRLTVIVKSIRDNVWTLNVVLLDSDIFIFHWLECTTHLYMFIYSVFSINIYLCTCCTAWLWLVVELKKISR